MYMIIETPVGTAPIVPWLAEPVALYRHLDQRGELLYVGITSDLGRRWAQHAETSLWARFTARTYVQWYPDRAAALRAEKAAIRNEAPIFNTARPGNGRRVTALKLTYLHTGRTSLHRRVPCTVVRGEFCVSCGPDAEAWLASTLAVVA